MKCANGKWKYGEHGNCQFDTLADCKAAAAAIHINNPTAKEDAMKPKKKPPLSAIKSEPGPHGPIPEAKDMPTQSTNPHHDAACQCASCMKGMYPKY
jgi:hypothetical protein